jgi:DoxX-like family
MMPVGTRHSLSAGRLTFDRVMDDAGRKRLHELDLLDCRQSASKLRELGYWIATVLSVALFAVPGAALIARVPHFTEDMSHLGYPEYFLPILGTWKVLGAATILVPVFQDSRNGPTRE